MARAKRTAVPNSEAAVLEDLHVIRANGGLRRAEAKELSATLGMLFAHETSFEEAHLVAARAMLETHINRSCQDYSFQHPNDPCALAAAWSVRLLLLPVPGTEVKSNTSTKASVVRRDALKTHDCHLGTDGLRKREDQVLAAIAKAAFAELKLRREGAGPQTIEEVVHMMRPLAEELREYLHDGLQELYPDAGADADDMRRVIAETFYLFAQVQGWCRSVLTLRERIRRPTPAETLFAEAALRITLFPRAQPIDHDAVYKVIKQDQIAHYAPFWNAILDLPHGGDILGRWRAFMTDCHETCTYHRSPDAIGSCEPHNLTLLLETFVQAVDELEAGTLDETLALEYEALGVPSTPPGS